MTTRTRLAAALLLSLCLAIAINAQTPEAKTAPAKAAKPAPAVTLSPTAGGVRVVAQGAVSHVRLEVYPVTSDETAAPDAILSTNFARGSLHDWRLVDGQGLPLPDGKYLFVVTARDLDAQLWIKQVTLVVERGQASIELADAGAATNDQKGELKQKLTTDTPALTVTAHTGRESQIVSTRGGFSFRTGNLFAGLDREVLHISADGNVRVPGTFTATKGIEFADGTVQMTGTSGRKDAQGNVIPATAGAGTQNHLAKWTDNAGTLGDSVAIDTGVGLQMTVPASNSIDTNVLYTIGNDRTTGVIASSTPAFLAQNGPYFALRGNSYTAFANQRGIFSISGGNVQSPTGREGAVQFLTGADQIRMLIDRNGNVGIGTTSPGVELDVQGSVSTFNGVALALTNHNAGNTNPWVLGTGGRDIAKDAFSIGDSSSYKMTFLANGNIGIGTINPLRTLQIGADTNALFTIDPTDGTPNAGYIRFGDRTGWKLHFARSRESSGGALNTGTAGELMAIVDNGNIGIGTANPQTKLDVRGDVKLGSTGQFFATGGEENLRIIRGYVDQAGNVNAGSGFTIVHNGTGFYVINFNTPFPGTPSVTVSCQDSGGNACISQAGAVNGTFAVIALHDHNNNSIDNQFFFIIVGPR